MNMDSALGPTLFLIFINDIDRAVEVTSSVLLKFADDTKVGRVLENEVQRAELQGTIDRLVAWSTEWQMLFNGAKCHILHLGAKNAKFEYTMAGTKLEAVEYEKDVGVLVHPSLKPSMQCARAAARANGILGQLSRAITYRDRNTFLRLYKVYARPHLEYAVVCWSPWTVGDKEVLEKVQRRAVGMVTNWRGRTYESRLAEVGMTTLEDRRARGDMIATYMVLSGKDGSGMVSSPLIVAQMAPSIPSLASLVVMSQSNWLSAPHSHWEDIVPPTVCQELISPRPHCWLDIHIMVGWLK